jgi:hypothetical protein
VPAVNPADVVGTVDLARQVALVRVALGAALLAAPVPAARSLGLDSGTARRTSWLLRMTAARDAALGAGALTALAGGSDDAARWLAAGAASDLADAVVVARAMRTGRLGGVRGALVLAASASGALAGAVAAVGLRRR